MLYFMYFILPFVILQELPDLVARLNKLRTLYLGYNAISLLPDQLCQLTDLRHLSLRQTNLQDLPLRLDSLRQLTVVDLDETHVPGVYKNALMHGGVKALLEQVAIQRGISESERTSHPHVRINKPKPTKYDNRDTIYPPELNPHHFRESIAAQSHISQVNQGLLDLSHPPASELELTIGKRKSRGVSLQHH